MAQHQQQTQQQQHVPHFSLGPGQGTNILDFSQAHNVKTYYKTISPLPAEDCFDGPMDKVEVFLATIGA